MDRTRWKASLGRDLIERIIVLVTDKGLSNDVGLLQALFSVGGILGLCGRSARSISSNFIFKRSLSSPNDRHAKSLEFIRVDNLQEASKYTYPNVDFRPVLHV